MELPIVKNRQGAYLTFLVNGGELADLPTPYSDLECFLYGLCAKKAAGGDVGPQGPKGDTGATGPKGDPGAAGAKGADGKSVTAIALKADATGKVTGGTVTFSDKTTAAITVTTATA